MKENYTKEDDVTGMNKAISSIRDAIELSDTPHLMADALIRECWKQLERRKGGEKKKCR